LRDGKRLKLFDESEDKPSLNPSSGKGGLDPVLPGSSNESSDVNGLTTLHNEIMDDLVNTGLFVGESLPKATRRRAWELLHRVRDVAGNEEEELETLKQQLFEIFIQQEEYQKFSKNFASLENLFGVRQENDSFHWSNFRIEDDEDMNKVYAKSKVVMDNDNEDGVDVSDGSKENKDFNSVTSAGKTIIQVNDNVDFDEFMDTHILPTCDVRENSKENYDSEQLDINQQMKRPLEEEGDEHEVSPDHSIAERGAEDDHVHHNDDDQSGDPVDRLELIDKEGRLWSGCIIDNDMVQHTLPGGRVASHRALVAVGNGRGSGGYGIGKGSSPVVAVNNAFRLVRLFSFFPFDILGRAALRNLIHIDLYDNCALAHDLFGKHNSCHAYIKATPASRMMVASPFVETLLELVGITSASVSLVGKRDPYCRTIAIFNALRKHQNLDEYAKARGKRYLSEKWLREKGV
jgi:small subunit ribosomal protein S5